MIFSYNVQCQCYTYIIMCFVNWLFNSWRYYSPYNKMFSCFSECSSLVGTTFGGDITTASFNNLQTIVAHINLLTFNIQHVTLSHWLVQCSNYDLQYLIITVNMPYKCYHYRKYFTCTVFHFYSKYLIHINIWT